jgi:hypothetical protein
MIAASFHLTGNWLFAAIVGPEDRQGQMRPTKPYATQILPINDYI